MAMTRYQPLDVVSRLHDEINRLFAGEIVDRADDSSSATADWVPSTDVYEYADRYVLSLDVPGVDPKSIEISLENDVLTVSGQREKEVRKDEPTRRRMERVQGRFYRRFVLPASVDAEGVNAKDHYGVLDIEIPKKAAAQPRRIKVAA